MLAPTPISEVILLELIRARKTERFLIAGREVAVSNPDKLLFPQPAHTKLDLVRYYLNEKHGALPAAAGRPNMLV